MRWALVQATGAIMRKNTRRSFSKVWGQAIAKCGGRMRASIAVAQRLAGLNAVSVVFRKKGLGYLSYRPHHEAARC